MDVPSTTKCTELGETPGDPRPRPDVHVWRVSRVHGAWVHAGSPRESKRRALHLSSFNGIRHGRSAPRIVRAISFPFGRRALRMPCALRVLREVKTERGARAGVRFSPSRMIRQTLPRCFRSAPRTRKDHRFRCRHPPWLGPFSSSFSWCRPPRNHYSFQVYPSWMPVRCVRALLQASPFFFLLGCPGFCLQSGVCVGFFVRLRLRSGERFHEARVVPRAPIPGSPC